ncbi:MAG TPA: hypothetical protein VIV11_38755 [Kofleriaceae bacterium]
MARILALLTFATLVACARGGSSDQPGDAAPDTPTPIDAMIDGNGCATQPCSILPQCGCTQTSACDVDTGDNMGTVCRPVNVPGKETATCNGLDKCDQGYVCLGGATYATCKKYCEANADCGTPRGRCAIDISSGGMPIADIPSACSSNCNPLLTAQPAECPTSYKCGLFTSTHNMAPVKIADCTPAGAGTQGANCKSGTLGNESLCAQGFLCTTVDAGATYTCRRICNKTTMTGCAGAQTCLGFSTPHTIDIEYGVCN